jgi:type IV pilus assembly protein PilW
VNDRQTVNPKASFSNQKGFGLVELMVAMVLGLVLIGGVLSIFLSNQQSFRSFEGLSRIQENARISFELMARDVREAGSNLCGAKVVGNVVNGAGTSWALNWAAGTVIGASGTQTLATLVAGTAATQRVAGTDAIQVMNASTGNSIGISSNVPATAVISLTTSTHSIAAGNIVMACDSTSAAIFQVSGVTGAAISHLAGTGTPGNCSQGLGIPTNCATPSNKTFQPGGYVAGLVASVWYVGNNGRGGRSLYRLGAVATEEIAEGVTNMEIDYLRRNTATGALQSDWEDASAITDWTSTAPLQVVAVRIRLALESTGRVGTDQENLRRELIHVVNIRERNS